ncbi:MAG: ABC transporter permease, partial [Pseudomonadota bacterium]|nr:ABC transporter permease [Pseudomonadota bacterium]
MVELLQAERIKLSRHRAAWLTVWIFPIGLVIGAVLATGYELVRPETPQPAANAAAWIADTAKVWTAPMNGLGRYLIAAFTAVAFGGEYGWNTWKLIAPHRDRTALLLAKYAVVLTMLAVAFVLLAGLYALTGLINDALTNEPTPRGVEFGALLAAHGPGALRTTVSTLLTVAYASAAAVLTRSTMAGAIIAIVAVTLESAGQLLMVVNPGLYRWTPTHHLANLGSWIENGRALTIPVTQPPISDGWAV